MRSYRTKHVWYLRRREWLLLDSLLATIAILVGYALQPYFVFGWDTSNPAQPGAFQAALIYPWFVVLSMHVAGMHDPLGDRRHWFALLRVVLAVLGALGACLLFLYLISLQQIGRTILLRTFVVTVLFLCGARIILWRLAGSAPRRVGCFMSDESKHRLGELIRLNHVPVELVPLPEEVVQRGRDGIGQFSNAAQISEIVVASRECRRDMWLACLSQGIQVTDLAVFVEREYYKVACDDIDLAWFLTVDLKWSHPFYHRVKRVADVFVSLVGLLVSLPAIVVAGIAIASESGWPVFYAQTRVGLGGRPYRIWKLRTMCSDAERHGVQWARKGDTRVTRVGWVLRRTRLDELPQFWNVLKGEMSFVGPRPERPEFVQKLTEVIPMYQQRHWIKPGITGWAQINYPYGASVADAREKLCYDLYYLKNTSLLLDLHIALRTIGAIMKGSR